MGARRVGLATLLAVLAGGCSEFNMVPGCSDVASDIAVLFIPESLIPPGGAVDRARVGALAQTRTSRELAAGYNQRTCEAEVALRDGSAVAQVRFIARQSEGAQRWQDIQFLNPEDPAFATLVARLRDQYAAS